jgi:hypothetical protein
MTNEITQLRRPTEVAQSANVTALPTVVEGIVANLKDAIVNMRPDDVSLELTAAQDGHRTSARFSFRAYKRGRKIVDEESNV